VWGGVKGRHSFNFESSRQDLIHINPTRFFCHFKRHWGIRYGFGEKSHGVIQPFQS
jgi:hypothetical protein